MNKVIIFKIDANKFLRVKMEWSSAEIDGKQRDGQIRSKSIPDLAN